MKNVTTRAAREETENGKPQTPDILPSRKSRYVANSNTAGQTRTFFVRIRESAKRANRNLLSEHPVQITEMLPIFPENRTRKCKNKSCDSYIERLVFSIIYI